jgi:hypothetical protein
MICQFHKKHRPKAKIPDDLQVFEATAEKWLLWLFIESWKWLKHMAICSDASFIFGLNTDICAPLNVKINKPD